MLLGMLAAQPQLGGALAHHLTTHACPTPRLNPWETPEGRAAATTRRTLAVNPATPRADLLTLLQYDPALTSPIAANPHITTADLTTALAGCADETTLAALRDAPDPDGTFARHAYATAHENQRICRQLLEAQDKTPLDIQTAAALNLAAHRATRRPEIALLAALAHRHPHLRPDLLAAAGTPEVTAALQLPHRAAAGTDAWYTTCTLTDALGHLTRRARDPHHWHVALRAGADPDSVLADAALTAYPTHAPLLFSVAVNAAQPRVVQRALLSFLTTGEPMPGGLRSLAATHLPTSSHTFALTYAPHARRSDELAGLAARTDLPLDTLDVLTTTVTTRRDPTDRNPTGLEHPTLWGVVLATHANSTADQRHAGLALADSNVPLPPGTHRGAHSLKRQAVAAASLGTHLTGTAPAHVGALLPLDILTDPDLGSLVTIAALVTAAFTAAGPTLDSDDVSRTLVALAPTFHGTLGELLDTSVALTR